MTVTEALAGVMQDVTEVRKGDLNSFHKFNFRGIDRVINAVGPALRKHGVVVVPHIDKLDSRDVPTKNGAAREVTVIVTYTFHGPDGDTLTCCVPGEAQDSGDKAVSKAMSVAYRTALIQALTIPTEAADPDSQTYHREETTVMAWRKKIKAAADERGWDMDVLMQAFAEWSESDGGEAQDIREVDASRLADYYRHLVPPRKVRRAPVEGKAS